VIVGPDEATSRSVELKDLRAGQGTGQETVARSEVVDAVRRRLDAGC